MQLLKDRLKQRQKPIFSFNYVDFEHGILVIDDPLVVGDLEIRFQHHMDEEPSVGQSLFQYNDNNSHLERVRHVALANTHSIWMQLAPKIRYAVTGQANQIAVRRLRKQKELLVQRTIFRFRNLKTIKIITSGTFSSPRSEIRFKMDNDAMYDDMEENSVTYLRLLRSKKIWLPGPWLAPDIKLVEVVDESSHRNTSPTAPSDPHVGDDLRYHQLFPAGGFLPDFYGSTWANIRS